jgi:glutathione S-transferase
LRSRPNRDIAGILGSRDITHEHRRGSIMLALYHNDMSLCAQKVRLCLAEKGLPWEDRHLVLREGQHQQPRYLKLNRRAVVPTLIDGDKVVPESNVILEYLEETYPHPRLSPSDSYGRARMRLWTKQLDEDVHDASAAVISFGIAFRHQYLEKGELGAKMLEQIPNVFKRERRRDVIEKGPDSQHFIIAVHRMVQLLDEMEEALTGHSWLVSDVHIGRRRVHALSPAARASQPVRHDRGAAARRRLVPAMPATAELHRGAPQMGEPEVSIGNEGARGAALAASAGGHVASVRGPQRASAGPLAS